LTAALVDEAAFAVEGIAVRRAWLNVAAVSEPRQRTVMTLSDAVEFMENLLHGTLFFAGKCLTMPSTGSF
jgi:hypothetical protein